MTGMVAMTRRVMAGAATATGQVVEVGEEVEGHLHHAAMVALAGEEVVAADQVQAMATAAMAAATRVVMAACQTATSRWWRLA